MVSGCHLEKMPYGQNTQDSEAMRQVCVIVCLAIYEVMNLNEYKMNSDVRGLCLIINITNFDKGDIPLHPRSGATKDVGQFHVFLPVCFVVFR